MKLTLYHKETGEAQEFFPVDAREIVAADGSPWGFDKPVGVVAAKPRTAKPVEGESKKSPLRLVPNLTQAGEAFLHSFGIQTLEELSATPFFRLEQLDTWKALDVEDQEPIEQYMLAAASSAQTKSSVSLPGRQEGKRDAVGPKVAAKATV